MGVPDNPCMSPHAPDSIARLSPKTVGWTAAVVTVLIWTSFIVIARASADPSRGGVLNPFDIVYARLCGAGLFLLPWGLWLNWRDRMRSEEQGVVQDKAFGSMGGLSPLPLATTVQAGLFGGLLYATLAYNGFVFAPAAHASVLMPGSLPLWTALLALALLGERIAAWEQTMPPLPQAEPAQVLSFLMTQHGLTQADLPEVGSQGVVSEILAGKRRLNVRQIEALATRFGTSPAVFFPAPSA